MKHLCVTALAAVMGLGVSAAQAADFSTTLTTTPVLVVPRSNTNARQLLRIIDVESAGAASAWCSRASQAAASPNAPGAYELTSGGGNEEFRAPGIVPQDPVWCAAASGTVRLTAEAIQ